MHLFQVFVHRELTPEKGQEMLAQIIQAIDTKQMSDPVFPQVKIEGVTRHEDPFPDWLREAFKRIELQYDPLNLCYYRRYKDERDAVAMMSWFEVHFRPWASKQQDSEKFFKDVHSRVMDDHADLSGLSAY